MTGPERYDVITGPGHYQAAEISLQAAEALPAGHEDMGFYLAIALVHAALALAAATALNDPGEMTTWDADAWRAAAGTPHPNPPAVTL